jgi:hypothetical protein
MSNYDSTTHKLRTVYEATANQQLRLDKISDSVYTTTVLDFVQSVKTFTTDWTAIGMSGIEDKTVRIPLNNWPERFLPFLGCQIKFKTEPVYENLIQTEVGIDDNHYFYWDTNWYIEQNGTDYELVVDVSAAFGEYPFYSNSVTLPLYFSIQIIIDSRSNYATV